MGAGVSRGSGDLVKSYPALAIRSVQAETLPADLLAAALDDFDVVAIEEIEDGLVLRAFFGSAEARDDAARGLAQAMPSLRIQSLEVSDEDWAARSQAALKAVRVGALIVAPPWDLPDGVDATTIVILPSTGFGTGHHATTRLCLGALQRVEPAGKTVIDVGTGSGVLALAAAKLGASRAVGIDNDQDAIDNALENRDLNAAAAVEFVRAGVEDAREAGPFEIVLANLTGGVLIRFARDLTALAARDARLILSGLREEEERDVLAAFGRPLVAREAEDGWICLVL
jgi:ribosomal protein L11 methyltransferase